MNPEFKILSRSLRERRLELGVSQMDIARLSGLSLHSLSNIETGKGNPTVESLMKLLRVLGLGIRLEPATGDADEDNQTQP